MYEDDNEDEDVVMDDLQSQIDSLNVGNNSHSLPGQSFLLSNNNTFTNKTVSVCSSISSVHGKNNNSFAHMYIPKNT